MNNYKFEFDYNDGYFLTDPNLFVKNHYPSDTIWLLTKKYISIADFLNGPIVYADAFKQAIIPISPSKHHLEVKQNQEIIFSLKELKPIDVNNISVEITLGTYKISVKPSVNKNKAGLLEFKYTFSKRGSYDFHIKLKEEYLVTYTVKVKK